MRNRLPRLTARERRQCLEDEAEKRANPPKLGAPVKKHEENPFLPALQWAVCRLYDVELITASRACELLGCKQQEFRALYAKFPEEG